MAANGHPVIPLELPIIQLIAGADESFVNFEFAAVFFDTIHGLGVAAHLYRFAGHLITLMGQIS